MKAWPRVTKTAEYRFSAKHDLHGKTSHPDGKGPHSHEWVVTLSWESWEVNPAAGFTRDEPEIDAKWGARIQQLHGADLNSIMPIPPTSENLACWLLFDWLTDLSANEKNYELSRVRVSKCARFTAEVDKKQRSKWELWT